MDLVLIRNAGGERQMERGATGRSAGSPLAPAPKVTSHSAPAEKLLGDTKLNSGNSALQFQLKKC